jgi:branched-chain amino acid transport system ATP-binding protein
MTSATPLLELVSVENGYGISQVLFDISFSVAAGECVSVQGRNGMGKSTTVKSILGIQPVWRGDIRWKGQPVDRWPPHRIARQGVGLVPEGRQIFPNLTVRENLIATAVARPGRLAPWDYARVVRLFPRLAERANNFGNQLSGGEQQMLAIGRALMSRPRLLLLDEPSMGLAPMLIAQIFQIVRSINEEGISVLLVEQNATQALRAANRAYVLETGYVVKSGSGSELLDDPAVRAAYLGG